MLKSINRDDEMRLWETELHAVCVLSGEIKPYRGIFINAANYSDALRYLRLNKFDYLQLTGNYFNNYEEVLLYDKGLPPEELDSVSTFLLKVKKMDYDAFMDYIEATEEPLLRTAKKVLTTGGKEYEEYLKILKLHLKLHYDNKKKD